MVVQVYIASTDTSDRRYDLARTARDRRLTCTHRNRAEVHGAGAALTDAAAVFGAGQLQVFTQRPQQRSVVFDVEANGLAVQLKFDHLRFRREGSSEQ